MDFSRDQENELGLTLEKMFQWLLIYDIHITRNVKQFFNTLILKTRCLYSCCIFIFLLSKYCFFLKLPLDSVSFGIMSWSLDVVYFFPKCPLSNQMSFRSPYDNSRGMSITKRKEKNWKNFKSSPHFKSFCLLCQIFLSFSAYYS
jgi:hypothetical protein